MPADLSRFNEKTLLQIQSGIASPPPPPPPYVARPGPRGLRVNRLVRLLVRIILGLLVALAVFIAVALLVTPARETVLVMGSDARPDELAQGDVGRTDTMMMLVADRATPRLATISVPRDLWVNIPGHGEERINAAYEFGGPKVAEQTVRAVVGQPIDRYMVVGLQGVRDIVDAVGGVDITVDQPIHDDAYPTDDYGVMTLDIPAGRQHMDGETALEYARTRHQDSDFGRAARQQRVLAAVRTALLTPTNWPRLPATLAAINRSVRTDVNPLDAVAVAAAFLRNSGDPDRLVIDTTLAQPFTGQDGAYLLQARPGLQAAVAQFLHTAAPARVQVLNGSGVAGAASTIGDRLTQQGFQVAGVDNADRPQTQTTLQTRSSSRSTADAIAQILGLPGGRVSETAGLPSGVDVRVVVGSDLGQR